MGKSHLKASYSADTSRKLNVAHGNELAADGGAACSPKVSLQRKYGPQSKRGGALQLQLNVLEGNSHAQECFREFERHEKELCGEYAVFYHSYSYSALLYEVNTALASILCGFHLQNSVLPRLLYAPFNEIPDAPVLMEKFKSTFERDRRDHHPDYRAVAFSVMCSLVALGPEVSTPVLFLHTGYSQKDLPSYRSVLDGVLSTCRLSKKDIKRLVSSLLQLAESHGLDASMYGGKARADGKAGHMLQIFIRRDLVDKLSYAAMPWGHVDADRHPISHWVDNDSNMSLGQARIVAHPRFFSQADCVRIHPASADPVFHRERCKFQKELTQLLGSAFGTLARRRDAAIGIFGGTLPTWWEGPEAEMGR